MCTITHLPPFSKENDAVIGLHNPVYGIEVDTLRPSDQSVVQYSTQGPAYETIDIDNHNGYDVIDRRVPHPQPVSHTQNNKSVDQDYSVLSSENMDHDYNVLENTGGGLVSGGEVQDYEVPLTRRK